MGWSWFAPVKRGQDHGRDLVKRPSERVVVVVEGAAGSLRRSLRKTSKKNWGSVCAKARHLLK